MTNRAFFVTYKAPSVATNRRGIFYENPSCMAGILSGYRNQKVYTKTIGSYRNNQNLIC